MKPSFFKLAILISILFGAITSVFGQTELALPPWVYNGTHIYNGNSGNVGIGLQNPLSKLHIQVNNLGMTPILRLTNINNQGSPAIDFYQSSSDFARISYNEDSQNETANLSFSVFNTERLRISDWGRIDITGDLVITGVLKIDGSSLQLGTAPSGAGTIQWTGTDFQGYYGTAWKSLGGWSFNGNDIYYNSGKVGIGITNPGSSLHVGVWQATGRAIITEGDIQIIGGGLEIRSSTGWQEHIQFIDGVNIKWQVGKKTDNSFFIFDNDRQRNAIEISSSNGDLNLQKAGGIVTIGVPPAPSSSYILNVGGKIRSNEIIVNTTGADFVFEDSYNLRSLSEVENFINKNKHLPEIPTAKEVQENGVSLGEMQSKLLQKIEELTLYMIELKKENEVFSKQLEEVKKLIPY